MEVKVEFNDGTRKKHFKSFFFLEISGKICSYNFYNAYFYNL